MSSTPTPPRRLRRSRDERIVSGVCGGVADYLTMDPTLVRLLTVVAALVTGGFPVVIAYLVAMFVMPEEPMAVSADAGYGRPFADDPSVHTPTTATTADTATATPDPVWGAAGAPWEQPQPSPSAGPAPHPAAATDGTGTSPRQD